MSVGSLARRYAKALIDLGVEGGNLERLGKEIAELANAIKKSPELEETLSNPAFPPSDREKVLQALLLRIGAAPTAKNFTMLLLERERLGIIPDISRALNEMIDERMGRVDAEVVSATILSPAQESQLKQQLERLSGKKVTLTSKQDPDLLGGFVARVGDVVYDSSLRSQLNRIQNSLAG
jgi:F-type H+-transporting ATPase subunit delta